MTIGIVWANVVAILLVLPIIAIGSDALTGSTWLNAGGLPRGIDCIDEGFIDGQHYWLDKWQESMADFAETFLNGET